MQKAMTGGTMPESLFKVARQIGDLVAHSGMDPVQGAVWIALICDEKPLTSAQIAGLLGITVDYSNKMLIELERWGAAKKTAKPDGSVLWAPEMNPLKFTVNVIKNREEPSLKVLDGFMETALNDKTISQFAHGRLKFLQEIIMMTRLIYEIIIAISEMDFSLLKKVRDVVVGFTKGMGGVLGALPWFGKK